VSLYTFRFLFIIFKLSCFFTKFLFFYLGKITHFYLTSKMVDPKDIIPVVVDVSKTAGRPPAMPQPGPIEIIGETINVVSSIMSFLSKIR
jgi:hypothetical protein